MKQINHTFEFYPTLKILVYILAIAGLAFVSTEYAYAFEILTIPEKKSFGPNDSLLIYVEIVDYTGGDVNWVAHKPDGSSDSGILTALKGGKKTHLISRTAFDNQFGIWKIDYTYKNISKTISIHVDPLILELSTDKQSYISGDLAIITLWPNYFQPNSAKAEIYSIQILDKNNIPALHMSSTKIKAFKNSTTYSFLIDELLNNNPFGDYKVSVQYYNIISEVEFSVEEEGSGASVFIGTDKQVYDAGEIVQVQLVISDLVDSDAVITITDPIGKKTIRSFLVTNSLTRLYLDDVSTNTPGTYQIELSYGGSLKFKNFSVEFESTDTKNTNVDLRVALDKQQYAKGETINAGVKTDKLIADTISYWLVDPSGNQGVKISKSMSSGNTVIPFILPKDAAFGPWKFYVDYGGAENFAIFFVANKSGESSFTPFTENSDGPKLAMTIQSAKSNLNNPKGIAIDSNEDIFVVDSGNFKIKKFDSDGNLLTSWGKFGSEEGQFDNPSGIFIDSKHVHIADTGNSRIQTFDKEGNFVRSWGDSGLDSKSLKMPNDIAVYSNNNFLVSDSGWNKILKYNSDGNYLDEIKAVGTAAANFYASNSVTTKPNGNVLILVSNDNRILEYSSEGSFIKFFGSVGEADGKFQNPTDLALDSNGNLYVADSGNSRIQVFDSNNNFLRKWGQLGNQPGQFNQIEGIALDHLGNVFVVDSVNNRIQKFGFASKSSELEIPDWVRNNAQWWNEGTINDGDFAAGIQYLIKNNIIIIPDLRESTESSEQQIPEWVKNNAGWWAAGQISDDDFANGIEFLVANGIIQV